MGNKKVVSEKMILLGLGKVGMACFNSHIDDGREVFGIGFVELENHVPIGESIGHSIKDVRNFEFCISSINVEGLKSLRSVLDEAIDWAENGVPKDE